MESYKQVLEAFWDHVICSHCEVMFTYPDRLHCGHILCSGCVRKIDTKNKEGQRCYYCSECGAEAVRKGLLYIFKSGLWELEAAAYGYTASLGKERSTPEACSDGDSGVGDIRSECSFGSSWSISSMWEPPGMASKGELFDKMCLSTYSLKSEDDLSQRPPGSSDCSENEQPSVDTASARRPLSGSWRYLFGRLFESKLPQQNALASFRAHSLDPIRHMIYQGTQGSLYKTGRYKKALIAILNRITCPNCKEILTGPVTLDCGHSICWPCAEKTESENKEGRRCCRCPQCGVESPMEHLLFRFILTRWGVATAVNGCAASLWKGRSTPEACSDGDSWVGDIRSECSFGSSCSITSMLPPPTMSSKGELCDRISLPTDGQESEHDLSQRRSSDCSEREQQSEDETSTLRSPSGAGRYSPGGLFKAKVQKPNALASFRAHSLDSIRDMIYQGTQGSPYGSGRYKKALIAVLNLLICTRCKGKLSFPVTLDCSHSVCWDCAEKVGTKNKEGRRCYCCKKCGVESMMEDFLCRLNLTLLDMAVVSHRYAASVGKVRFTLEAWDSGGGDIGSGCSFGFTCSVSSMRQPSTVASKGELFDRMFLQTDDLKSEDELSQHRSGSSDCSEREQPSEDKTSVRRSLSSSGTYLPGDLFDLDLPVQNAPGSSAPHITDSLTHITSDGTHIQIHV